MTETTITPTEIAEMIREAALDSARHTVRRSIYYCETLLEDESLMMIIDAAAANAQWVEINLEIGDVHTILDRLPEMISLWQSRAFHLLRRKANLTTFDASALHAFGEDLLNLERRVRDLHAVSTR